MYIVPIAWLYVVMMMAVAEATNSNGTLLGAIITFVLYGLAPVGLVLYIIGTPARKRAIKTREARETLEARETHEADEALEARAAMWQRLLPAPKLLTRLPYSIQMEAAMRPLPPKAMWSRRCE